MSDIEIDVVKESKFKKRVKKIIFNKNVQQGVTSVIAAVITSVIMQSAQTYFHEKGNKGEN